MKKYYFFILFIFLFVKVQCQIKSAKNTDIGTITLVNNENVYFKDLVVGDEVVNYFNLDTQENEKLYFASIKNISNNLPVTKANLITKSNESKEELPIKDTFYRPSLKEGVYYTKEDFLNQTPDTLEVYALSFNPKLKKEGVSMDGEHIVWFQNAADDKKIRRAFAVSYKGHLYFQIYGILKNRNKKDRAQTHNNFNAFVRVSMGGDNYFYTETPLTNQWAQGFAYGTIGGTTGGYLANSFIYFKGVVWDKKNQEFNIFRNCYDYNKFIENKYPDGVQKCTKQQANIWQIREAIQKIK